MANFDAVHIGNRIQFTWYALQKIPKSRARVTVVAMSAAAANVYKQDSATITSCKPENVVDAAGEQREKVKSKMEVGKFFGGFITLLLGILLKDHLDSLYPRSHRW